MEISPSPPTTDPESFHSQEVEELHHPEGNEGQRPIRGEQDGEDVAEGGSGTGGDQCDYLVFDLGGQKGGKKGGEEGGEQETEEDGEKEEGTGEAEAEDETKGGEKKGENDGGEKVEAGGETEEKKGGEGGTKEEDELLFLSDGSLCPSSSEQQEAWCHDPALTDDFSDCLQAELAIVYSDSDTGDDQWAGSVPGDVTNQEEAGDGENREEERGGDEEEKRMEGEARVKEQEENSTKSRRDLYLHSPSCSSTASSTDPDRRVRRPIHTL